MNLYVSHIQNMTMQEFMTARQNYCKERHNSVNCKKCSSLLTFANDVSSNCVVPLAEGYKKNFRVQYKSDKAIRQIMQLPVVAFRLKEKLFVTEYRSDMNHDKFVQFINMLVPESVLSKGLSKESLKMLCDLASTEKDKKLIRVAATAHVSATEAKARLGVSDLVTERDTVCKALEQYIGMQLTR